MRAIFAPARGKKHHAAVCSGLDRCVAEKRMLRFASRLNARPPAIFRARCSEAARSGDHELFDCSQTCIGVRTGYYLAERVPAGQRELKEGGYGHYTRDGH
jgi:hypothetical protein